MQGVMNERFGHGICESKVCLHVGALDPNSCSNF